MKIETEEFTLPAHWASFLVNGDDSGLSREERTEIEAWERRVERRCWSFWCVGVSDESFFAHRNDANNLGADCATFTFQRSPLSKI